MFAMCTWILNELDSAPAYVFEGRWWDYVVGVIFFFTFFLATSSNW